MCRLYHFRLYSIFVGFFLWPMYGKSLYVNAQTHISNKIISELTYLFCPHVAYYYYNNNNRLRQTTTTTQMLNGLRDTEIHKSPTPSRSFNFCPTQNVNDRQLSFVSPKYLWSCHNWHTYGVGENGARCLVVVVFVYRNKQKDRISRFWIVRRVCSIFLHQFFKRPYIYINNLKDKTNNNP